MRARNPTPCLPARRGRSAILARGLARATLAAIAVGSLVAGASVVYGSDAELDDLAVARGYLEALYRFDFDDVRGRLHEDAVFDDPTSVAIGAPSPWHVEGRDDIVRFFRDSSAGTREAGFEVVHAFAAAGNVVLTLRYRANVDGAPLGHPGVPLEIDVRATTIIGVRDGRVDRHVDYVDYPALLRQVEEQIAQRRRQEEGGVAGD